MRDYESNRILSTAIFKTVSKFLNAIKIPFMIFLGPEKDEIWKNHVKEFSDGRTI